ncbi:MAG: transposase [Alphaproteobacteria bacterium]|nr:MAG: transposase [Alphaproteobacteria bacterium]
MKSWSVAQGTRRWRRCRSRSSRSSPTLRAVPLISSRSPMRGYPKSAFISRFERASSFVYASKHSRTVTRYQTDLTDTEWRVIAPHLPKPCATGRPREWPMREIVNGIFLINARRVLIQSPCRRGRAMSAG